MDVVQAVGHINSASDVNHPSLHEQMRSIAVEIQSAERRCKSSVDSARKAQRKSKENAENDYKAAVSAAEREAASGGYAASTVEHIEGLLRSYRITNFSTNDMLTPITDRDPAGRLTDIRTSADQANAAAQSYDSSKRYLKSTWWLLLGILWPLIPMYLIVWIILLYGGYSNRKRLLALRTEAIQIGMSWSGDLEARLQNARASANAQLQQRLATADDSYNATIAQLKSSASSSVATLRKQIQHLASQMSSSSWDDKRWSGWSPVSVAEASVRLGTLVIPTPTVHQLLPSEKEFCLPAMLQFCGGKSLLIKDSGHRELVNNAIQSVMLRLLAMIPPGKLRFTFIDPVGLGQNVAGFMHLQDHDETLVTGKAWTEPQHIEKCLADVTKHMEDVIQKYLRQEFASIEDYNEYAGEVAEPYKVLVVFDFPCNFSDTSARRLVSIMRNGARCGVYAFVVVDTTKPMPYGVKMEDMEPFATVLTTQGKTVNYDLSIPINSGIDDKPAVQSSQRPVAAPTQVSASSPSPAQASASLSQGQATPVVSDSVAVATPAPPPAPEPDPVSTPSIDQQPVKDPIVDIVLVSPGPNVTAVKEALQVLAEGSQQPDDVLTNIILKGYKQAQAQGIKSILEDLGASVELRSNGR